MSFIALALARFVKKRRRKTKKARRAKQSRMQDTGGDYLKQLLQATQPGAPKKELPYVIPPIETIVELDEPTHKTIRFAAGALGAGIAIGGIAIAISKSKS